MSHGRPMMPPTAGAERPSSSAYDPCFNVSTAEGFRNDGVLINISAAPFTPQRNTPVSGEKRRLQSNLLSPCSKRLRSTSPRTGLSPHSRRTAYGNNWLAYLTNGNYLRGPNSTAFFPGTAKHATYDTNPLHAVQTGCSSCLFIPPVWVPEIPSNQFPVITPSIRSLPRSGIVPQSPHCSTYVLIDISAPRPIRISRLIRTDLSRQRTPIPTPLLPTKLPSLPAPGPPTTSSPSLYGVGLYDHPPFNSTFTNLTAPSQSPWFVNECFLAQNWPNRTCWLCCTLPPVEPAVLDRSDSHSHDYAAEGGSSRRASLPSVRNVLAWGVRPEPFRAPPPSPLRPLR